MKNKKKKKINLNFKNLIILMLMKKSERKDLIFNTYFKKTKKNHLFVMKHYIFKKISKGMLFIIEIFFIIVIIF